ncbi:flagellar hook-basal body complex protein [Clostridium chromiireducens]|uniref:Flagellar basal-body rod protein FlgG n=1 Tax=Clostridium chromiireducens TaxID=225345 RepID=A0A1V4IWQ9_9CLOT|nr:flagellar hook-basal body complex protein [Clostridium chromiireducens]OPJ64481.1 flagellar basal-body rod protein FlgG [Clostridium chromiireducens]
MFNIFATGKSGLTAYQEKLDYLSNDLVNSTTTGYKSTDVGFKDLLTESLNRNGTPLVDKSSVTGTGVKLGVNYATNEQGNLLITGQKTDLAIDGKGYFALTQASGNIVYTRDGSFKIDSSGSLVDTNGAKVYVEYENGFSEGNPALDSKNISIDKDGGISTQVDGNEVKIGKIPIFTAIGDKSFNPLGNSYFTPASDAQVTLSNDYNVVQGALEGSNVNTAEVFSDVILTQRAFQLSSKAITTADDLWSMINSMR